MARRSRADYPRGRPALVRRRPCLASPRRAACCAARRYAWSGGLLAFAAAAATMAWGSAHGWDDAVVPRLLPRRRAPLRPAARLRLPAARTAGGGPRRSAWLYTGLAIGVAVGDASPRLVRARPTCPGPRTTSISGRVCSRSRPARSARSRSWSSQRRRCGAGRGERAPARRRRGGSGRLGADADGCRGRGCLLRARRRPAVREREDALRVKAPRPRTRR